MMGLCFVFVWQSKWQDRNCLVLSGRKGLSAAAPPPVVFVGVQDTCVGRHIQGAIIRKVNEGRGREKDPILIITVLLYRLLVSVLPTTNGNEPFSTEEQMLCLYVLAAVWLQKGTILYELYDNTAVWGESRLHSSGTRQGNYRALISNE